MEHFWSMHAVSTRPLLLLLDGHVTHYQPGVIQLAREHWVSILCLPLHTTHETQPLDCGVFAPHKSHWNQVCHDFLQQNPGEVVTKFNFNPLVPNDHCIGWYFATPECRMTSTLVTSGKVENESFLKLRGEAPSFKFRQYNA